MLPKNSQKGVIGLVGILLIGAVLVSVTISATKIAPQIKEAILSKLQGLPKPSPSGKVSPTPTPTSAPIPTSPSPTPQPSYRDPGGKISCSGKFNSCCVDCKSDADCTPGAHCQTFPVQDELCGYSSACAWPPTPSPAPTTSPSPTSSSQASPTPNSSTAQGGSRTSVCHRVYGEEQACCSYCISDGECSSGEYCRSDGCNTYCDTKPSATSTPTPRPSVSPAPTPIPQSSQSSSPNPTPSPVPFEPYCSAIGEWKSNQTCCYDCRRNSDCTQGTCRYDEVCGSYCLLPSTASPSPTPTPEVSPTSQAKKSQELLPGNFLYPLKNISRGMRVFFTFDQKKKAQLYLDFANEKIDETYILAAKGKLSDAASNLKSYTNDLEKATKTTANLRENKSKEGLSKKILTDGLNHQVLLRLIEQSDPSKTHKEVEEARISAITYMTQSTQAVPADILRDTVATLITNSKSPLKALGYAQMLNEMKPHFSNELKKVISETEVLVQLQLKTSVGKLPKEQKEFYLDQIKTLNKDNPKTLELIENAEIGKITSQETPIPGIPENIPQFSTPEEYLEWFKKFYNFNFEEIPPEESNIQPIPEENPPEPEEQSGGE